MRIFASLICSSVFLAAGCASAPASLQPKNPWREAATPAPVAPGGHAEAIGGYAGGCVRGATSLPPDGPGYEIMRLTRGRFYGHPELIHYIGDLAGKVARRKLGVLLIGDLAQARGGPTLSNHRSHQTGLDVDIWYVGPPKAGPPVMTLAERETLVSTSVVTKDGLAIDPALWTRRNARILEAAVESPRVDRVFVNAAIKRELCARAPNQPEKRAWLRKLRPWFGHDDHFHVRLKCPAEDKACTTQEGVPEGDGCDATLDWWFSAEAREKAKAAEAEGPAAMPNLPEACAEVLKL